MRFAVFTLHNLSQAELRVERKVICTKEDTSLQLHEKKIPFESGVGDSM